MFLSANSRFIRAALTVVAALSLNLAAKAEGSALFKTLYAESQTLKVKVDAAIDDDSNESLAQRRARFTEVTREGLAFIKKVIQTDGLSKNEKRIIFQDVAREMGFGYFEFVQADIPVTTIKNSEILDPENDEHRWSPRYIMRSAWPWIQVTGTGIVRDLFAAFSPFKTVSGDGIQEGYEAVDERGREQASKKKRANLLVPAIVPALFGGVVDHPYQIPFIGKRLPRVLPEARLPTWADQMANIINAAYEEFSNFGDDNGLLGAEAIGLMFTDVLGPYDDEKQKFIANGINDSRTIADGAINRWQKWAYGISGGLLVWMGPDFLDAGSPYVTQAGVLVSRLFYLLATYSAIRVRTVSTTVEAYGKLQAIVRELQAKVPYFFNREDLDALRVSVDELRPLVCEAEVIANRREDADASTADPKKKKKKRAA